jgi:ribose 5-phosphate isomerase B
MRVAFGCDHRGVLLRDVILQELAALGHEVVDLGAVDGSVRVDYPVKAAEAAEAIGSGAAERAVLVCSTGVGVAIAACKHPGIRASVCHDLYSAHQAVEHDDMNVLCLGSEIVGVTLAVELVRTFLAASFDGEEGHRRRLDMLEPAAAR